MATDGRPKRVQQLTLHDRTLNGSIPAELGELSQLRALRLARNELSGAIPAELGNLTWLRHLDLGANRLSGAIPAELGGLMSLGHLDLGENRLSGAIPAELRNLLYLHNLYLDGNRLEGAIPPLLRELTRLEALHLQENQLSGEIPPQLGSLTALWTLRLDGNRLEGAIPTTLGNLRELHTLYLADNLLEGPIPTQLGGLLNLRRVYLKNNSGLTGCLPGRLVNLLNHEAASLNLPPCPPGTPPTPMTQLPTHTLTVTATGGGSVTPAGTTTHDEDSEVRLTASWNEATHNFGRWEGGCNSRSATCSLIMDENKTVRATFTALHANRCATPTAFSCIRAVYKGAPYDYAHVADIPSAALLRREADGRYHVERGQRITVVTAAPLPEGYTHFSLQRRHQEAPSPTLREQSIPPLGTTFNFTVTVEESADLITFDLTAARPPPGPGGEPQLGNVVVTTAFQIHESTTCARGRALSDVVSHPDLVAGCDALLELRDTLAGTGTLNWSTSTAITGWTGVTVGGTPPRVTKLSLANSGLSGELSGLLGNLTGLTELRLSGNSLTGRLPSKLVQLAKLTHAYFAGNPIHGCVRRSLLAVPENDFASLGLADCPPLAVGFTGLLEEGTYSTGGVIFDVPAGLRLEYVHTSIGIPTADHPRGVIGLHFRDADGASRICLEAHQGYVCGRLVVEPAGTGTGAGANRPSIESLFDRIAESLWLDPR